MRFAWSRHPSPGSPGALTIAVPPPARPAPPDGRPRARGAWRSVALPSEHGGWGLTLEPALLGLALVPSTAGCAVALAGMVAFLARTPLKLVAVDHRRGRALARTAVARRIAMGEVVVISALAAVAVWWAGPAWLAPVALAVPLVGTELWFDVRSRSRRLMPELCGAVGMGALAAAVVVAGGGSATLAAVAWSLLLARSVAAIPWVRAQVLRLRGRADRRTLRGADLAQLVGTVVAVVTTAVEPAAALATITLGATALVRVVALRRPPRPAVRLGVAETFTGALVVLAAAIGLHLGGAV